MPLTRIYRGRVTKLSAAKPDDAYPVTFTQLDHLENALWQRRFGKRKAEHRR